MAVRLQKKEGRAKHLGDRREGGIWGIEWRARGGGEDLERKRANGMEAKAYKKESSRLWEVIVIRFFGRTLNGVSSFFLITTFG